ncbi:MAG: methylenetetrahydrofolate reductase, partial [Anaerolineales bacterium]
RNIFVVMGDPTAIGDYPEAMDNYDLRPSGLIRLIKQGFNAGMDHSGANIGQPTSFFVGCALNLNPGDIRKEVDLLNRKIRAGADFILTQPVYIPESIAQIKSVYEDVYGPLVIPILAGVLPLASARHAAFLHHEIPGIVIPEGIMKRMERASGNEAREGIKIAIELVERMAHDVQGIYLMPAFNRFDFAAEIIETIRINVGV